ncbi:MAG: hypothetical protein HY460_02590 [Parcubacteria group bacterium]|nr:hypothetical protein [Parcubacteria group bacterium]
MPFTVPELPWVVFAGIGVAATAVTAGKIVLRTVFLYHSRHALDLKRVRIAEDA